MSSYTLMQSGSRIDGRPTRASWLASELRRKIIHGELQPNSKLNLEHLRDRFEISLSPLREAISRLVAEGLVELEDQRGFRVAPISIENLTEITLLRAELDTLALKQSMAHSNLDWEAAVTGAVYRLVQAGTNVDQQKSQLVWMDALCDFQTQLLRGGHLPQLNQYTRILRHQMDRYILLLDGFYLSTRSNQASEYKAIADAAIACDEALATALLSAQIRRQGNNLAIALKAYLDHSPIGKNSNSMSTV